MSSPANQSVTGAWGLTAFNAGWFDSAAIAERITSLYEHRDLRAAMGAAAMATARSLDWNNYQAMCADFYRTLFLGEKIIARPERTNPAAPATRG